MAYPYYPYAWIPPYPPDPYTMMYEWMSLWSWYLAMTYYMETYKAMLEVWKRFAEELGKSWTLQTAK